MSRNIIITGASRGIGRAIALKISEPGDNVIVNYLRSEEAAKEVAEILIERGVHATCMQGNVRSEKDLKRLAAFFDSVDILIHNAAIGVLKPMEKIRANQWDLTLESSLRPFWLLSKHCTFREGAQIIGLSSLGSRLFTPGYAAMGAAKAGLEALTRQLAVELSPKKIRVNTVCGGLIDTDALNYFPKGTFQIGEQEFENSKELLIERTKMATPLGRIGVPEDLANAVWLLTRPEAGWITGQIIVVDGGFSLL
jgi:enoyl-[acyl-carrier protein] reductase III